MKWNENGIGKMLLAAKIVSVKLSFFCQVKKINSAKIEIISFFFFNPKSFFQRISDIKVILCKLVPLSSLSILFITFCHRKPWSSRWILEKFDNFDRLRLQSQFAPLMEESFYIYKPYTFYNILQEELEPTLPISFRFQRKVFIRY